MIHHNTKSIDTLKPQPWLLLVFLLYVVGATSGMLHHEMWADELHSWNIAKGSAGFGTLVYNTRFEGHPPAWLALLWCISKFTYDPFYMQIAQLVIAILAVYLVLFHSRFPLLTRILLPFGYYFLFEYGMLSRNYGAGVLLAFLVCMVIKKEFSGKWIVYYLLLLLLSNVHLLALLLAGSLHMYVLLEQWGRGGKRKVMAHIIGGILIFLPAIWFISVPSGSGQTIAILVHKTAMSRIAIAGQAPLRAFIPLPAWWTYHFWNTEVFMEWKDRFRILKLVIPLISLGLIGWACFILKADRKSLLVFIANTLTTFMVGIIFSLHTERYVGFLFIGFVVAYWLYCTAHKPAWHNAVMVHVLLGIQLVAGVFAWVQDIRFPFSNMGKMKQLTSGLPSNARLVTDYRALNATVAYLPQPLYCIDMERTLPFILWNTDMEQLQRYPNRYDHGLQHYFRQEGCQEVFLISTGTPATLALTDSLLFKRWNVHLIKQADGAIEVESNIYLYKISGR